MTVYSVYQCTATTCPISASVGWLWATVHVLNLCLRIGIILCVICRLIEVESCYAFTSIARLLYILHMII